MFTGIITDIGTVTHLQRQGDTRLHISTAYPVEKIDLGASIACSGVCLTVVGRGVQDNLGWLAFDASTETLSRTVLVDWTVGTRVNLERALKVGDELGGHIVSGHVDGIAEIIAMRPDGGSMRFDIRLPENLKRYVAEKGSIALDGVSLTVNEVIDDVFGVNIIPHTQAVTTVGSWAVGTKLNVEIDMMARYVARLVGK
jgi:riboflavin synthase